MYLKKKLNIMRSIKNKSVTVVIGVILLISILFLFIYQYQVIQIPQEKLEDEFQHDAEVSKQIKSLQEDILISRNVEETRNKEINMGVEYQFNIFFNSIFETIHSDSYGRLKTKDFNDKMVIKNAVATGKGSNYWNGRVDHCESEDGEYCYNTTSLQYSIDYSEYENNTVKYIENQNLYSIQENPFANDTFEKIRGDEIINNDQIKLTSLSSNINIFQSGSQTLAVKPISSSNNVIQIKGEEINESKNEYKPIVLKIPTRLNEEDWRNELIKNIDSNNYNLEFKSTPYDYNIAEIEINGSKTYELELSKIHLQKPSDKKTPKTEPAYVTWRQSDRLNIQENNIKSIKGEVRDKYNNPIRGATVKANAYSDEGDCYGDFKSASTLEECDGYNQPGTHISDSEGRVTFSYKPPSVDNDRDITIELKLQDETLSNKKIKYSNSKLSNSINASNISEYTTSRGAVNNKFLNSPPYSHRTCFRTSVCGIGESQTPFFRILDISVNQYTFTEGREQKLKIIVDNVGNRTIERDISLTYQPPGGGVFRVETKEVRLVPNERRDIIYNMTLEDIDTPDGNVNIRLITNSILSQPMQNIRYADHTTATFAATVLDTDPKNTLKKTPTVYKDRVGGTINQGYTSNIPPVEKRKNGYNDTSSGNLVQFPNLLDSSNRTAKVINEEIINNKINIGIANRNIFDNYYYYMRIDYKYEKTDAKQDYIKVELVDNTGKRINPYSVYALPETNGNINQVLYPLTPEEIQHIQKTNRLSKVLSLKLENKETQNTVFEIKNMEIISTYRIANKNN